MIVFLVGMVVDVANSAFELSTRALSLDSECELSFRLVDNIDETNVVDVSVDTSFDGPYEVHEQSQHSGDDHDDILLCAGFGRKHWMGFDIVLLNELDVPVTDGICRNFDPCECVDANPLDVDGVSMFIGKNL